MRLTTNRTCGQTAYVDAGLDAGRVDLRVVHPRIAANSADADVRIVVCTGTPIGAEWADRGAAGPLGSECRPWRPGRIRPGDQQLAYVVTPAPPGIVRVDGAHVEYADGIRTGSQRAGVTAIVRVR